MGSRRNRAGNIALCILFLSGVNFTGQSQNLNIILEWNDAAKPGNAMPGFKGAVYPNPGDQLPFYVKVLSGIDASGLQATLLNPVYGDATPAEQNLFKACGAGSETPVITISGSKSAGKALTELSFCPYRTNPETRKTERLLSGTLQLKRSLALKSSQAANVRWKDHSVLASGYWYKVGAASSGIYKLSYSKLIELGISNPAGLRIYGNGGAHNPLLPGKRRFDDLTEIPLWFETGSDGVFNAGDYVLVYLQGPGATLFDSNRNMLLHQLHRNSDLAYYFLTFEPGNGKKVAVLPELAATATHVEETYLATAWHEEEMYNLIRSGARWYGERFDLTTRMVFNNPMPGLVSGSTARLLLGLVGRNASATSFSVGTNSGSLGVVPISEVNPGTTTGAYASFNMGYYQFNPSADNISVVLDYNKDGKPSAVGWLDYYDLNAECALALTGVQLPFRSLQKIAPGEVAEFVVKNAGSSTRVWDVTDLHNPRQLSGRLQEARYIFKQSSDSLREYICFNADADFPSLKFKEGEAGPVQNQNLHGGGPVDFVIITHPLFKPFAEKLAALHRSKDQLRTMVATTYEVYNEFSSGAPDVTAYRDLMKMLMDKSGSPDDRPRYLLLYGDGTYDNRGRDEGRTSFVLTYQSDNSLIHNTSYVTDDYFGLLDDGETEFTGALDIGIGRFPVKDTIEADSMYGKVCRYLDPGNRGTWKNLITFIGDDEDNGTHTEQADELAQKVETEFPGFQVEKIYLDAYQQQTSPSGQSYPEVNKAIYDRVHKGALLINYTGHGNENGLAHERILQTNDILSWSNGGRLPLFVTATCEFSRFDDVSIQGSKYSPKTSAGEEILLNVNGGGIGLLTTTRLVYSGPNFYLNEKFYDHVFTRDSKGERLRLGDVMRLTKVNSGSGINKLNFTLLGDPALALDYPQQVIIADSVNGEAIDVASDTLKAFSKVRISGHFEDVAGNRLNTFNGEVFPQLYDKALKLQTLDNDGEGPLSYSAYTSVLFRGVASVKEGLFDFSFLVPRDINYQVGKGKLILYGLGDGMQAQGASKELKIGSISEEAIPDEAGPKIQLFLNDSGFVNGAISSPDPLLKAWIFDEAGINITSSGIGHDIVAVLDEEDRFVLNDYYQSATDDYSSGLVSYPFTGLSPGNHSLRLKVWDINNNSSEVSLQFRVTEKGVLQLEGLKNYPNPISDYTTFEFRHNFAGEKLDVSLRIYSLTGQLVLNRTILMNPAGFTSEPIRWDGRDGNGARLSQGIYIYRISVQEPRGQVAEESGKLVILKE